MLCLQMPSECPYESLGQAWEDRYHDLDSHSCKQMASTEGTGHSCHTALQEHSPRFLNQISSKLKENSYFEKH